MEDEESLKTGTVVRQLTDPVKDEVNDFLEKDRIMLEINVKAVPISNKSSIPPHLSNGVVTTSIVVGGILLSTDNLLRVVQLTVGSRPHLVAHGGLKIDVHGTGDVLSGTRLTEEGVEGIIAATNGLVGGHLAVGLDSVLEAEQLPAGIADLNTGLAHMD